MKTILLFSFFLFLGASAFAGEKDTLVIQTNIYCDHCVECGSCWPRIEEKLLYTKGVKYVWFDDKAMTISIVYLPKKTNPDALRKG